MKTVALIVTYNRLDKLKLCWAATAQQSFDSIVIVNNASTDDTEGWLNTLNDPRLHLLHLKINSGGAGGFKQGASYISERIESDWVFIYDDDAYPQNNVVEAFVKNADLQNYGAFSCKVLDAEGMTCKMNLPWTKFPNTFQENISYLKDPTTFSASGLKSEDIISLSFVGAIVRSDVLSKTFNFIYDELFIYFDDIYFSHHLSLNSVRMSFLPDVFFTHDILQIPGPIKPVWKIYYLVRNMLLAKKYFGKDSPFSNWFILLRIVKYTLLVVKQADAFKYIKYFLTALWDGINSNVGKRH
jgi:GT2 family glycosyltransferase